MAISECASLWAGLSRHLSSQSGSRSCLVKEFGISESLMMHTKIIELERRHFYTTLIPPDNTAPQSVAQAGCKVPET
jgi:hypothetical protein